MEARIQVGEFAFKCICHELRGSLWTGTWAGKVDLASFAANLFLAMCTEEFKCLDGFLEPLSSHVLEVLMVAAVLHLAFINEDQVRRAL